MILRQSDASRCPGLQTPHADARRPPRERFSPSTYCRRRSPRSRTPQLGRIPDLHGSPWEGPETAPKPSLHCERETGSTDRGGASRFGSGHETDLARFRQTHTGRGRHRPIRLLVALRHARLGGDRAALHGEARLQVQKLCDRWVRLCVAPRTSERRQEALLAGRNRRNTAIAFEKSCPNAFVLHFRRAVYISRDPRRCQQTVVSVLRK
jgi:hypothetical protein